MHSHLVFDLSTVRKYVIFLVTIGCLSCVKNPPSSHFAVSQISENTSRSHSEVASQLRRFWASVQNLGTTPFEVPPILVPVDLENDGRSSLKALISVQKTLASTSTWSVSLEIEKNPSTVHREVTLYLKKSPQLQGPDIHAEWQKDGDPESELSDNIWFESLISDPKFIYSDKFKIIFKTLSHAAWVSLDPDLRNYVDAIIAMTPKQVPPIRSERDESEIKTVKIVDFSGRGLQWAAPESDWYRKPWLTYEKTDLTPKCDLMGFEKTRIHLVPINNTVQIARGSGPWKLEIVSHFYPFYLPFPVGLVGTFYLEDGTCSLFQKKLERRFARNSIENWMCVDSLLKLLVNSSPIGKKVDNRIRVIDYFQRILGSP